MAHPGRLITITARALALGAVACAVVSCGPELNFPHAPMPDVAPSTTAPTYAAFLRGHLDTLMFAAQDANGDVVQSVEADLSELPAGNDATFSTTVGPGYNALACTLRWTAAAADSGLYRVSFIARNGLVGPTDMTLIYTVDHAVDRFPVVTCPDTVHVVVGVPQAIPVTAADPDGDPIFALLPPQPLSIPIQSLSLVAWSRTLTGSTASGTLQVRANVPGWFPVQFQAINAARGFSTTIVVAH